MIYGLILISFAWVTECEALINRETIIHNDMYREELIISIPQAIHLSNVIDEIQRTDRQNFERCALTLAVARYESTFNLFAQNKTCLGMYQMTVSTLRDVLDTSLFEPNIKYKVFTPLAESCIFNLLMNAFEKKKGSLYKALIRYNNSHRITKKILKYYNRLINEKL